MKIELITMGTGVCLHCGIRVDCIELDDLEFLKEIVKVKDKFNEKWMKEG